MFDDNKKCIVDVELTENVLLKNLYWTVNKFKVDPDHKQQNSSREDLIGGFFDRWISRIPEYLIFNELLPDDICPIIDNFIYTEKTSKNAPDIIGVKENGTYFPFAKFMNNRWKMIENAPFIEMKVFRESQNLITIPSSQFNPDVLDKYYAIVESYVPDEYLISIFCSEFFSNEKLYNEVYNPDLIKNFVEGEIKPIKPDPLKKPEDLGGFRLLGIYKGSTIKNFGKNTNETQENSSANEKSIIKPLYLKNKPSKFFYKDCEKISVGIFDKYYYMVKSIPIIIEIIENSNINVIDSCEKHLLVYIEGSAKINGEEFLSGFHRLLFEPIFRNGIKYYNLDKIQSDFDEEPVFEKELKLLSGLLFHYGDYQYMIECSFELNNHDLRLVLCTNDYLTFKTDDDNVKINGKDVGNGVYRFDIKAHDEEKSNEGMFYRKLVYNNSSTIKGSRKYSRYYISIENGENDFDEKCIDNPKFDLSDVTFEVMDSDATIIKKNNLKNFIVAITGKVKLDRADNPLSRGLYKFKIDSNGNKYYISDYEGPELEYPMFNDEAKRNINEYSIHNISKNHNVIDLGLIDSFKNNNSQESNSNESNENNDENEKKMFIPISFELSDSAELSIHEKNLSKMVIRVEKGWVKIDNNEIIADNDIVSGNFWNLNFEKFERSSKKDEFIVSKNALLSADSCENELLEHINKFIKSSSKR